MRCGYSCDNSQFFLLDALDFDKEVEIERRKEGQHDRMTKIDINGGIIYKRGEGAGWNRIVTNVSIQQGSKGSAFLLR